MSWTGTRRLFSSAAPASAAPTMGDPRFTHAVILVLRQDDTGAFGIVLNQPIEQRSVASLLEAAGDHTPGLKGSLEVFAGGPVQPEAIQTDFTGTYPAEPAIPTSPINTRPTVNKR